MTNFDELMLMDLPEKGLLRADKLLSNGYPLVMNFKDAAMFIQRMDLECNLKSKCIAEKHYVDSPEKLVSNCTVEVMSVTAPQKFTGDCDILFIYSYRVLKQYAKQIRGLNVKYKVFVTDSYSEAQFHSFLYCCYTTTRVIKDISKVYHKLYTELFSNEYLYALNDFEDTNLLKLKRSDSKLDESRPKRVKPNKKYTH